MCRKRPTQNLMGILLLTIGILILIAKILPAGVWWVLIALGLIGLGLHWCRPC